MTAIVTVRPVSVSDVDRVAELFALYREFYGQPRDVRAAVEFLRARLSGHESLVFVAEATDGAAVGFAQVYPTFASVELGPAWRLNDLYVAEQARRRGVGEALMAAVADAAAAAGALWVDLETARDNHVAQRLYERTGYARDDVFLHYVREL